MVGNKWETLQYPAVSVDSELKTNHHHKNKNILESERYILHGLPRIQKLWKRNIEFILWVPIFCFHDVSIYGFSITTLKIGACSMHFYQASVCKLFTVKTYSIEPLILTKLYSEQSFVIYCGFLQGGCKYKMIIWWRGITVNCYLNEEPVPLLKGHGHFWSKFILLVLFFTMLW